MRRSFFRVTLLLALVAVTAVALILSRPVREWYARAALAASIEHELNFTSRENRSPDPFAPESSWQSILDRFLPRRGWSARYHEQAQYFIHGPVVSLHLQGGTIVGDVRAALARLPHLREVSISTENSGRGPVVNMTEGDLTNLCAALHALPRLDELHLSGHAVTDDSIAPLAGHPTLSWLDLGDSSVRRITAKSADTFRNMPALKHLTIGAVDRKSLEAIVAAIPHVNVRMETGPSNRRAFP